MVKKIISNLKNPVIDHRVLQMHGRGLRSVLVVHEQADDTADAVPCDQFLFSIGRLIINSAPPHSLAATVNDPP